MPAKPQPELLRARDPPSRLGVLQICAESRLVGDIARRCEAKEAFAVRADPVCNRDRGRRAPYWWGGRSASARCLARREYSASVVASASRAASQLAFPSHCGFIGSWSRRDVGKTQWCPPIAVANALATRRGTPLSSRSGPMAIVLMTPWPGSFSGWPGVKPAAVSRSLASGYFAWNAGDALPMSCRPAGSAAQTPATSSSGSPARR